MDLVMPHVAAIAAVMVVATGHSIIGTWLQASMEASGTSPPPASVYLPPDQYPDQFAAAGGFQSFQTAYSSLRPSKDGEEDNNSDVLVPLLPQATGHSCTTQHASSSSANGESSQSVVHAQVAGENSTGTSGSTGTTVAAAAVAAAAAGAGSGGVGGGGYGGGGVVGVDRGLFDRREPGAPPLARIVSDSRRSGLPSRIQVS